MQLTEAQQQLIVRQLQNVWKGARACPACAQPTKWEIGGIMELREYHEGNVVLGGSLTPVVVVVCEKCGGTQLFNAIKLGLVDINSGKILNQ
jgi:hypothetical protein